MFRSQLATVAGLAIALSLPGFASPDKGPGKGGCEEQGERNDNRGQGSQPGNQPGNQGGGVDQDDRDQDREDNNRGPGGPERLRIPLAVQPGGAAIRAEGKVDLRIRGERQRLEVEVEADVPDGTRFNVFANGIPVGVVTIQFGEGELEFDNEEEGGQLPAGLTVAAITLVEVRDLNNVLVLSAQFGAPGNIIVLPPTAEPAERRTRVALTATGAGMLAGAGGRVEVRVQGQRQRLKVEVEANLPDGTMFLVSANGVLVGSLSLKMGEGELELENERTVLPAGLESIGAIRSIQVIGRDGTLILSAVL